MKGSHIALDFSVLPFRYRGTWADRLENCYATSDRGRQITFSANTIGFDRIVKVEGHSDHTGVLVTVSDEGGEIDRIFLDISSAGSAITIRHAGSGAFDILMRCPS